jgi:hypothetical protein
LFLHLKGYKAPDDWIQELRKKDDAKEEINLYEND